MTNLIRTPQVDSQLEAAVRLDDRGVETMSTHAVKPQLRSAVWEARNRSHLIGLKAGSPAPDGLMGTMRSAVVNGLSIADITGNAHTVERTPVMARQLRMDAVMMTFILQGETFHYNADSTLLVKKGEVAIYDSDTPHLLGMSADMHVVVACLPRYHLADIGMQDAFRTIKVMRHTGGGVESQVAGQLLDVLRGAFDRPAHVDVHEYNERFIERALHAVRGLNPRVRQPNDDYFEEALAFIHRHVGEPGLSTADVAGALNLSQRHLGRVFAARDTTVGQQIQEQRLGLAHELLTSANGSGMTAAEIALRSGFTSPSHFSRAFRGHYGRTPTEARKDATAQTVTGPRDHS